MLLQNMMVYNRTKYIFSWSILICIPLLTLLSGCGGKGDPDSRNRPELLVYCGMSTSVAFEEVSRAFEELFDCKVSINSDTCGHLMNSIKATQQGDLFLPSAEWDMYDFLEEGIVLEYVTVGYNQAVITVRKDNPLHLKGTIAELADEKYLVGLCDSSWSAIGQESLRILQNSGLYDAVMVNVNRIAPDSKTLGELIKNNEIDLALNWSAAVSCSAYSQYIDVLPIRDVSVKSHKILLGLLRFSKNPALAKKFLEFAISPKGKAIFHKHRLLN